MARRHRNAEEHENTERWLVSYADFITLLFAFFVVMYSLSSINEGKYRVLSDSLVQAFRNADFREQGRQTTSPSVAPVAPVAPVIRPPRAASAREKEAEARRQQVAQRMRNMADAIRRVLGPLAESGGVSVSEGAFGVTVEINASVLFAPGEAVLGSEASAALRAVAGVLAETDFPITVEGHTDTMPINNYRFPSNWELSAVRASSVVRLFIENGVAPARLTAAGYADQRPVAANDNEEGRARNRRVAIMIESRALEPASGQEQAPPGADDAGDDAPDDHVDSILPPVPPPAFDQIEVR
ncbi:MAG: flagellar motor protein MotD [Azoarcus sp.]|jgi:chemotaxis protein MotB|nr:flagellar motor protein MotD [Azoarcus sp.]